MPAGPQRVTVDYLGYEPAALPVDVTAGAVAQAPFILTSEIIKLDAYKVESIREGQSRAINQQRTSNTLKNIISSDAIGNLPDRTVGEALNRLPGVNVVDDSWASIRGTAAQYNAARSTATGSPPAATGSTRPRPPMTTARSTCRSSRRKSSAGSK